MDATSNKQTAEVDRLRARCQVLDAALSAQSHKVELQHRKLVSVVQANAMLLADRPTDKVLAGILDSALTILGASGGSIMLRDTGTSVLSIWASRDLENGARSSHPLVGEGIAGRVAETGEPILLSGSVEDPAFQAMCVRENVKDALVAPLTVNGTTIGVLNVRNSVGQGTFDTDDLELLRAFADQAAIAIEVARNKERVDRTYIDSVSALVEAIEARDSYTGSHSASVMKLATGLGRKMGLDEGRIAELEIGAALHDIGKIGIDDSILRKRGKLTDEEYDQVKRHPILAVRILGPLGSRHDIIGMIRHHHERYDGRGYPAGLRGVEIPVEARILAVADSYHAMASSRPYRDALPPDVIVAELMKGRGSQFDPGLVDIFLECLGEDAPEGEPVATAQSQTGLKQLAALVDAPDSESGTWGSIETLRDAIVTLERRLLAALEDLVGKEVARRLQREASSRALEAGLPYVVEQGNIAFVGGSDNVSEISRSFQGLLSIQSDVVAEAIGTRLFDRIVEESMSELSSGISFRRQDVHAGTRSGQDADAQRSRMTA